jgi:hypothetical protein
VNVDIYYLIAPIMRTLFGEDPGYVEFIETALTLCYMYSLVHAIISKIWIKFSELVRVIPTTVPDNAELHLYQPEADIELQMGLL